MPHAMEHCHRPWWQRPPAWFVAVAVAALLSWAVLEQTGPQPATPYSTFLDQVEAGNVASVTFHGTEINGRFKQSSEGSPSSAATPGASFRSRVPDIGDPALIPALHKRHVAIDVASPSAWSWLLGRLPWPMLIIVGAALVIGFVRFACGGLAQAESAASALPAHGLPGLVARLFARQQPSESPPPESPPPRDGDEPKSR